MRKFEQKVIFEILNLNFNNFVIIGFVLKINTLNAIHNSFIS